MPTRTRNVLVVAPSERDRRELTAVHDRFRVSFAGPDLDTLERVDAHQLVRALARQTPDGVIGTKDRAALLAALVARDLGLAGPDPEAIIRIQHKPTSRAIQAEVAPEATPRFALADQTTGTPPFDPPWFCKPVVGRLSQGVTRLEGPTSNSLLLALEELRERDDSAYGEGWESLAALATAEPPSARGYLVEQAVKGRECTLEAYVYRGRVIVIGVTDSVFYPGTGSFERFEYPSALPPETLAELGGLAERLVRAHGFGDGFFNVEFRVPERGPSVVIELNARIASQFSPLVAATHGVSTYDLLLRLACGEDPRWSPSKPRGVAVSYAVRLFEDAFVQSVPDVSSDTELYVRRGMRLSEQRAPNDASSYRVAVLYEAAATREQAVERCRERARELVRGLKLRV